MQLVPTPDSPPIERVQGIVDAWRDRVGVPGVAVAVRAGGAPVVDVASGVADLASGRPLTTSDRMWAGSITKTAVAAAALRLAERGVVELDAPLARWHASVPDADRITLRSLADHTAGMPDPSNTRGSAYHEHFTRTPLVPWSRERLLSEIAAATGGTVGTFRYSNAHYTMLGDVLERVTGRDLHGVLRDEVFEPSGAARTRLDPGHGADPTTVTEHTYGPAGDGWVDGSRVFGPGSFLRSTLGAPGGMVTTAPDLARLGEGILMRGGATLSAAARDAMLATADVSPAGYGLGISRAELVVDDQVVPIYWHNGHLGGAGSALVVHVPGTRQTVSVMLDSDPPLTADGTAPDHGALFDLASSLLTATKDTAGS